MPRFRLGAVRLRPGAFAFLAVLVSGCTLAQGDRDDECPGGIGTELEYVVWDVASGQAQTVVRPVQSWPFCTPVPPASLDEGLLVVPSLEAGSLDVLDWRSGETVATLGDGVDGDRGLSLWSGTVVTDLPGAGFLLHGVDNGTAWGLEPGDPADRLWTLELGGPAAVLMPFDEDLAGIYHLFEHRWIAQMGMALPPGNVMAVNHEWLVTVEPGHDKSTLWTERLPDGERRSHVLSGYVAEVVLDDAEGRAYVALLDSVEDEAQAMDRLVGLDLADGKTTTLRGRPDGYLLDAADGHVLVARFIGPPPDVPEHSREPPPQPRAAAV